MGVDKGVRGVRSGTFNPTGAEGAPGPDRMATIGPTT